MVEIDGEMYESEEDYLDTLKEDDSYSFSIEFEYTVKDDDDGYDTATAVMDVDVDWSDSEHGYVVTYSCSDEDQIDPDAGNGDLEEFYETAVYDEVMSLLESEGIDSDAIVNGGL